MAQTPKQKKAAKTREGNRAHQIVGKFLKTWNLFESALEDAIKWVCELKTLDAAVITANLNFQSKMAIVMSMVELYTRDQSQEWKDRAKKTFNRAFDINSEWRNVIAHNIFVTEEDKSIRFIRIQAKRELKIPDYRKTKKSFASVARRRSHSCAAMS